jgi:hypothetical protein
MEGFAAPGGLDPTPPLTGGIAPMNAPQFGPFVHALLCQRVEEEQGVMTTLHNLVTAVTAPPGAKPPIGVIVTLFAHVERGTREGAITIDLSLVTPSRQTLAMAAIDLNDGENAFRSTMELPLRLEEEGEYRLLFSEEGGGVLTWFTFTVDFSAGKARH